MSSSHSGAVYRLIETVGGICNRWTGEMDWIGGLEYWTGVLDWSTGLEYWIGDQDFSVYCHYLIQT